MSRIPEDDDGVGVGVTAWRLGLLWQEARRARLALPDLYANPVLKGQVRENLGRMEVLIGQSLLHLDRDMAQLLPSQG